MEPAIKILLTALAVCAVICVPASGFLFAPFYAGHGSKVCRMSKCFNVELATTHNQREQGLMFRNNLDEDSGMLFVFEKQDKYPFWMKNTLIPLDIIWINSDHKVVYIAENSKPCAGLQCASIISPENAKYVLEINAGMAKKTGIKPDDFLEIGF